VKRLGINQTTLVHYETGKIEPRIGFLINFIKETGFDGEWLLTGKGDMYGESKKIITKEEAIKVLFGDKADEVVLYMIEAIKDPFLRAILFTRASEYKDLNLFWISCFTILSFEFFLILALMPWPPRKNF